MSYLRLTEKNILIAFKKLQAQIYFDKGNLHNRKLLAEWKDGKTDNQIAKDLSNLFNEIERGELRKYLDQIDLLILPKSVNTCETNYTIPQNFYTNNHLIGNAEVKKLAIFIKLPIELQIIVVFWLMRYGAYIDNELSSLNFGNRLLLNDSKKLGKGRTLFKPYQEQYQHWWDKAVTEAKDLLQKDEDVTILNLDFKGFFHSVRLNFEDLSKFLNDKISKDGIRSKCDTEEIYNIVYLIHDVYLEKLKFIEFNEAIVDCQVNGKTFYPLPIGMLTSHVLANWYMKSFDSKIQDILNPIYYGRYVDDLLIVLKDRVLKQSDIENYSIPPKDSISQIIRKIKDSKSENEKKSFVNILTEIKEDNNYVTKVFFAKYLNKIFEVKTDITDKDIEYYLKDKKKYPRLSLQTSKVALYQFNHNLSPNLLNKFVKDQEKRNYIFQFLSDNIDDQFGEFEIDAFEESFDDNKGGNSKFKPQDLNNFRFSVFIAKLIKRRTLNGNDYKNDEIEKISKYFKGIYLLHHYQFWEKIMTLFVVANRKDKLIQFIKEISDEIDRLKVIYKSNTKIQNKILNEINFALKEHLKLSLQMSIGISPSLLLVADKEEFIMSFKNKNHELLLRRVLNVSTRINDNIKLDNINLFRRNGLLRAGYIYYPIIQFIPKLKNGTESLNDSNVIMKLSSEDFKESIQKKYLPFRVKFYEVALFNIYKTIITHSLDQCINSRRWYQNEIINSNKYLKDALIDFKEINGVYNNDIDDSYLILDQTESLINDSVSENCGEFYISNRSKNYQVNQIHLAKGGKLKGDFRIAIINKYVDLKDFEKSLEGDISLTEERTQSYLWILDEIKKVPECDLFVMPELALPQIMIPTYVSKVAHNQIGFISGIEHWTVKNIVNNFVITVLPINVHGDLDAVPIIRLKNHYAPDEEDWINKKNLIVSKPFPYKYDLLIWRGIYFSTYYCYELADVFHRNAFFGKVDVLIAPVWNKDVNFYNNIIETTSRDMHTYVVQVNTSQYGESRVVRPTETMRKDKARIKGGTVNKYPVTLSISDIKIDELRKFQLLTYGGQKDDGKFKPTPPDFPLNDVKKRIQTEPYNWDSKNLKNNIKNPQIDRKTKL